MRPLQFVSMQLHLLIIPQKLPVKIYGKRNLIQRDVLVFAVDGCVLLAVDVDGAKRITASESAENRLTSVPAGRIKGAAAA